MRCKLPTFATALAIPALVFACGGHGTADSLIVSTAWLASHLKGPHLVILAVGARSDYDAGHIPGSLWVDYAQITPQGSTGLTTELPSPAKFAEYVTTLGVGNDSRVVIYRVKDSNLTQSARVLVTFDAMGLGANVSLLDGSLATWTGEGRAVTTEVPQVQPGKLDPCPQSDVVTDLAFVKDHLHSPGVRILDARSPEVYSGAQARPPWSPGHIQGAGNVFFNSLFDDAGKLKPAAELKTRFSAAGVKPGDRVVTYCFIGQQASALYVVSRYLGYDTRLYDGSWEEWMKHPELPTEAPAASK
jgi:thiosulfate/3-mercaptopyruvate sulfurtransferase